MMMEGRPEEGSLLMLKRQVHFSHLLYFLFFFYCLDRTVAVAVDTSHALQRLHGELPFVLASTSSRTKIVAPWMDTLVTLSSSSSSTTSAGTGHGGIPATSQCKWKADFRGTFSSRGCTTAWFLTVDYYSVLNHPVDGPFIEWKRGDAASMR
jgi:hypothetical protein